jgi:hypothetical protein
MKPFITIEWNEDFIGVAFYFGFFPKENTFEMVLQIGWLEIAIGVEL